MNRRHSVVDACSEVNAKIRSTTDELVKLWNEVSMTESSRVSRLASAFHHIKQLCDDMLNDEKEMVRNLKISIRDDLLNVQNMRAQLEMDPFDRPDGMPPNSVSLMKHLQREVERLEVEYKKRQEEQQDLVEKLLLLKKRMDYEFEFEHDITSLFPVTATQRYNEERLQMEETLRDRYNKIENWQSEIRQWKNSTENVAKFIRENSYIKNIVEQNIDDVGFVFSESMVEQFETAHNEMKPLYENWLEDMEFRWTEKYQELSDLWQKCMIADEERLFEEHFEPGRHSEESFRKMCEECETLAKRYASCKMVYDLVESWKAVWNEKVGIEEKRRQPDYYKKVNVLPDNKRERELQAMLPNLENQIRAANRKHEEENDGHPVLIHGVLPIEHVNDIRERHKMNIKFELQLKREEKTRINSPHATPRSQKRPNPYFRTPKSAAPASKKLNFDPVLPPCMSPVTSEAISFITPTRQRPAGPLTSSPKTSNDPPSTKRALSRAMTPSSTASSKRPFSRRN